MAAPAYATIQGIREEAGLQQRFEKEEPDSGAIDGANTVFVARRSPFVDTNGDDAVTVEDVTVYVDGAPVSVASINADAGSVTLEAAPAADSIVLLTYATSPASDSYVEGLLAEATSWINNKVQGQVALPYTTDTLPEMIKTVARLYAGALALIRDYGSSTDTDLSSKDGYKKLQLARDLLADYLTGITDNQESTQGSAQNAISVKTDGNIFERNTDLDNTYPSSPPNDDFFMRRE